MSIVHRNMDIVGGGERIIFELANRLCNRGYDVRLYTMRYDPEKGVTKLSKNVSVELIPLRNISPWPLYNEVASILLFPNIFKWGDIIFWSGFHTGQIAAAFLSKLHDKPIIYYCHWPQLYSVDKGPSILQDPRRLPLLILDRLLTSRVDIFMANSQYTARFVKQIYGVTPKVINPGVDVENFSDKLINKGSYIVLSVCRADPMKRIELLIRAMRLVINDLKDAKLYIVGSIDYSPDYTQYLFSLIRELGLEGKIYLTGKVSGGSLVKFYQMCDVFCLFSREDTFGIVVLEAMSCGKPVIVSAAGALPDLVEDGKTGFVIQGDSVEAFTEKIKFLLTHPEIRTRMGKEGRRLVEKRFTWDVFSNSVEDAIINLVKR